MNEENKKEDKNTKEDPFFISGQEKGIIADEKNLQKKDKNSTKKIISVLMIALGFYFLHLLVANLEKDIGVKDFGTSTRVYQVASPNEIVAIVDGKKITRGELERYEAIYRNNKSLAINNLIKRELLYNEFKESISLDEIRGIIEKQLTEEHSMTLEDFKNEIEKQGKDYEETYTEFADLMKKEIVVIWVFENFSDEEIDLLIQDLREKADIEIFINH